MSRAPSRASSYASTQQQEASEANTTAVLGAASAFGKTLPRDRQPPRPYVGANGALTAAVAVTGGGSKTSSTQRGLSRSPVGRPLYSPSASSVGSNASNAARTVSSLDSTTYPHLPLPDNGRYMHSRSPSQQAAAFAASRSYSTPAPAPKKATTPPKRVELQPTLKRTMKPAAPPKPRRLSEHHSKFASSGAYKPTDSTSIAPTTSLVDLFERRASVQPSGQHRPGPIVIKPDKPLAIRSPKPIRTSDGITSVFRMDLDGETKRPKSSSAKQTDGKRSIAPHDRHSSEDEEDETAYVSAPERTHSDSSSFRKQQTNIQRPLEASSRHLQSGRQQEASASPARVGATMDTAPIPIHPPARRSGSRPRSTAPSPPSIHSIAAQWHLMHPKRQTPLTTGDQLANAMVASSLASSRAPSPRKPLEPPPVPDRRRQHHAIPGLSRSHSARKKGMRHTLRAEHSTSSTEEEDDHPYQRHRKNRLVRKHPHKHHEGDRKRWRDAITERERKRYEGVWAANKGLHFSFTREEQYLFTSYPVARSTVEVQNRAAEEVSNIVTRDIWTRSRLSEQILEAVWDLVDSREVGRLSKEQFVVGMWLVDQRLKGRKLPAKVSESVWASARPLIAYTRK